MVLHLLGQIRITYKFSIKYEKNVSNNQQIEALMLRCFPTCPPCGADKGYYIPFAKNSVECKECHARWTSDDFEDCQDLVHLRLKHPSKGGKGSALLYQEKSIEFWKSCHQIEQTEKEKKELRSLSKFKKIEEMRCPLCNTLMLSSIVTFRVGGWSGKANVASDLLVSPLVTKIGQVQEQLLPIVVYFCVKCGKIELVGTYSALKNLLEDTTPY